MFALASLKMAIHRYAKSLSHLTSIHYIFVKQCLLAKCFDEALGILDIPIDDLDLGVSSHSLLANCNRRNWFISIIFNTITTVAWSSSPWKTFKVRTTLQKSYLAPFQLLADCVRSSPPLALRVLLFSLKLTRNIYFCHWFFMAR